MGSKLIAFVLPLVLALAACSSSPGGAVVGRWQWINTLDPSADGTFVIEFFPNGTVATTFQNQTNTAFNGTIMGKYAFVDEKRMKLDTLLAEYMRPQQKFVPVTVNLSQAEILVEAQVSGRELTLKAPENVQLIYKRL